LTNIHVNNINLTLIVTWFLKINTVILSTHFCMFILWYWTLLLHVYASVLDAHFYVFVTIIDTIILCICTTDTRISYYNRHYYFMYLYHRYIDTLLHWTLLFHVHVSSLHRYSVTQNTVVSYFCIIGMLTHLSI